uniref:Secreted protein n=1 Tax=Trichobilharzia regenti TaxID=157069 RepID=A0AA85JD56_TRIRE|nr:unnamed protein product [Trichobilharzia regenti]
MFNSMYRYISVITLLVFATMNESTSSKLGDMEELLKGTLNDLPELAKSITRDEEEITKLQNKIINEVTESGERTLENFVSCCRRFYESYSGNELFKLTLDKLKWFADVYGLFPEQQTIRGCLNKEVDVYAAKLRAEQAFDCEDYIPTGNRLDITDLKHKIRDVYERKLFYASALMLKRLLEEDIQKLKQAGVEN